MRASLMPKANLLKDEKRATRHYTIVDLMRNDLAMVAKKYQSISFSLHR